MPKIGVGMFACRALSCSAAGVVARIGAEAPDAADLQSDFLRDELRLAALASVYVPGERDEVAPIAVRQEQPGGAVEVALRQGVA
jgi:hypothetical protein